jgi:ABC-type uncharacterized transport system substrate-binding protein
VRVFSRLGEGTIRGTCCAAVLIEGQGERDSMSKRVICLALLAMILALGSLAYAQQPKKVTRIGYLSVSDAATESVRSEGIRLALRERGYIEGQNIAIEYQYAERLVINLKTAKQIGLTIPQKVPGKGG